MLYIDLIKWNSTFFASLLLKSKEGKTIFVKSTMYNLNKPDFCALLSNYLIRQNYLLCIFQIYIWSTPYNIIWNLRYMKTKVEKLLLKINHFCIVNLHCFSFKIEVKKLSVYFTSLTIEAIKWNTNSNCAYFLHQITYLYIHVRGI